MTNRAQAKPTNDPKDVIQEQSLLQVTFVAALVVFGTIVWLFWDDFWLKKPWKAYQSEYQEVVAKFLAEELDNTRRSTQARLDVVYPKLQEVRDRMQNASKELGEKEPKLREIQREILAIDKALATLQGELTSEWWQKEMQSIAAADKYKVEHGKGPTIDRYRTVLDEVRRRVTLISTLRGEKTAISNQMPELSRDLIEVESIISDVTRELDQVVQTMGAISEFERDWVQRFQDHGGSGDIIDRCETCHRGADEGFLDREKMWGSHLSNDIVNEFLGEYGTYDDGWHYTPMRQRLPKHAKLAAAEGNTFLFNTDNIDALLSATEQELADMLAMPTAASLESEARSVAEDDLNSIQVKYNQSLLFKGNPMLSPEYADEVAAGLQVDEETGEEYGVKPRSADATTYTSAGVARLGEEIYDPNLDASLSEDPSGFEDGVDVYPLPKYFFASEAFIYLSSEGPWPMSGVTAYPDRFGLLQYEWFQSLVNDERVIELYRMIYRKLRHHVQEKLLLFTSHPRRTEILGDVHKVDDFGCSTCHRGFGVNAKTIESAHGQMHHWLTPLFRDGYQEAGCQKCHKSEIELEGSKRIQRGKDLYQQLGCWGCHAYDGYEGEVGQTLVVAKEYKEIGALIEDAKSEVESAAAHASYLASMNDFSEAGTAATDAARIALRDAQRKQLDLLQRKSDLGTRLEELDIEHKKRGPSLMDLSVKIDEDNKGWIANWIAYPKGFRPSTKMPHFWYGPFAYVDQAEVAEAGGSVDEAFEDGQTGNPLYRRLNKRTVDAMKSLIQHVYQSSKVAQDLGKIRSISTHDLEGTEAGRGEEIFQDKGCMSCHGNELDLVKGEVVIPVETYTEDGQVDFVDYRVDTEWLPAPRYRYRLDGEVQRDGHGNAVSNEFIYSFAANLSRVGEKVNESYMVEWVLQPRLRNKHSIMPSFWPALSGTPDGAEREALDALIEELTARHASATGDIKTEARVLLADAKRTRGDLDAASRKLYADVAAEVDAMGDDIPAKWGVIRRKLKEAGTAYDEARHVVKYLTTLKHEGMVEKGEYDPTNVVNGYIGDYSYEGKVFRFNEEAGMLENVADMPLHSAPEGQFEYETIDVEGFGDFEFMDAGYPEYLNARRAQVTGAKLAGLSTALVKAADAAQAEIAMLSGYAEALGEDPSEADLSLYDARVELALKALSAYADARNALSSALSQEAFSLSLALMEMGESQRLLDILDGDASTLTREELILRAQLKGFSYDEVEDEELQDVEPDGEEEGAEPLMPVRLSVIEKMAASREKLDQLVVSPLTAAQVDALAAAIKAKSFDALPYDDMAMVATTASSAAVDFQVIRRLGAAFETITPAGKGRAYTAYYGCAGCHEIEGMEEEGKIGVELTYEGSKFIQRLDFGLLEHHAMEEDPKTPASVSWLTRGSLRPYNFQSQPIDSVDVKNPENIAVTRGGVGFELPEGIRSRYVHSKYDYHSRASWFQGKLHHPRQWDKGRELNDGGAWFERTRMPLFELNEDDLFSITLFIEGSENMVPWGAGGDPLPEHYTYNHKGTADDKVDGWHVLRKYNCIACHSVGEWEGRYRRLGKNGMFGTLALDGDYNADGLSLDMAQPTNNLLNVPPVLHDAGARLRSEWLVSWLQDPYEIRGMNQDGLGYKAIMPQFYLTKSEAEKVQAFLAEKADAPQVSSDRESKASPSAIAFGREMFKETAAACLSCHSVAEEVDGYLPPATAPSFYGISRRVNKDWVRKWLRNPSAIQPEGRMPTYFRYDAVTDRWVLRDKAIDGGAQDLTKVKELWASYEGDHVEALLAWIYEEMPTMSSDELNALYKEALKGPAAE